MQLLKVNIREKARTLGPEILTRVMEHNQDRASQAGANNWRYLLDDLNYKLNFTKCKN